MSSALRLLEQRAQRSKSWPEFAEYNCSACHHDLTNAKWRQEDAYLGKRRPGGLRWQDWYPETVRTLARQASGGRLRVMDRAVSDLQQLIDKPDTEPEWIARNARRVADDLERALPDLKNVVQTRESIANLFHGLSVANRGSNVIRSWEQAAQRYLALAALHDALNEMGQPDPHRAELLDAWERKLRLPRDYGSPRGFDPRTLQRR